MSDWAPGDLALCIGRGADDVYRIEGSQPQAPGPIIGLTYTVAAVKHGFDCYGRSGTALSFAEILQRHPRAVGFNALFFRKVTPPEADEFDVEVIELMNRQPIPVEA